jgi:hypothetical protein
MDKKSRPEGTSGQDIPAAAGAKVKADSGSPGKGSEAKRGYYINELGETCFGNECVQIAINPVKREVRVHVSSNPVCDIQPVIESLTETLGKGAKTIYEVDSVYKPDEEKEPKKS